MRAPGSIAAYSGRVSYFGMRLGHSYYNLCVCVRSDFCANDNTESITTQTFLHEFELIILIYKFLG